jgi:hypothetical protein
MAFTLKLPVGHDVALRKAFGWSRHPTLYLCRVLPSASAWQTESTLRANLAYERGSPRLLAIEPEQLSGHKARICKAG